MENIIELKGTKNMIADHLVNEFGLPQDLRRSNEFMEYVSYFIITLENNYDTLISDDEDFQKDIPRNFSDNYGVVSQNANYFISINKFTYILAMAITKNIFFKSITLAFDFVNELIPNGDMPLFHKLDQAMGESCVVLEAARNKIKGIDDSYYEKFRGECINNNLKCRLNGDGMCSCNRDKIQKICKKLCNEHILTEKSGRYFYVDFR